MGLDVSSLGAKVKKIDTSKIQKAVGEIRFSPELQAKLAEGAKALKGKMPKSDVFVKQLKQSTVFQNSSNIKEMITKLIKR